jgi:hypothetical protein
VGRGMGETSDPQNILEWTLVNRDVNLTVPGLILDTCVKTILFYNLIFNSLGPHILICDNRIYCNNITY